MRRHVPFVLRNVEPRATIEPLERRIFLSAVYDVDLMGRDTFENSYAESAGRLLDNGSILYFDENQLITQTARGEPSLVRTLGAFYGRYAAFSSNGIAAIAGEWEYFTDAWNSFSGVAIVTSEDTDPSRVIYGDASSPQAVILSYGTLAPSSLTFRVGVLYEDELLDAKTLTGSEVLLTSNGIPTFGTKTWTDGNFDSRYRVAEYSFDLPQPPQTGQLYSINIVANSVRDKAGHGVASQTLSFRLWPAAATSSNLTFTHHSFAFSDLQQPLPWPVQPLKDVTLSSEMFLQRDGSLVARASVGPVGSGRDSVVWVSTTGVHSCDISSISGTRLASLSEYAGVAVVTDAAGDLFLARADQPPQLRMFASASGLGDIRRPVIDSWGTLIAFCSVQNSVGPHDSPTP